MTRVTSSLRRAPRPPPAQATQFVNDGQYYFQVTDLSGTSCCRRTGSERLVTVTHGVLATYNGHTHETDSGGLWKTPRAASGGGRPGPWALQRLSVGLAPFRDAGSRERPLLG